MLWKVDIDVSIQSYYEGHVDAIIKKTHGFWRFSGFYRNPETEKRHFSWILMEKLSEMNDTSWIIGGDFNEIVSDEEKKGGAKRNPSQRSLFRETINRCKLMDGGYSRNKFTWRRGKNKRNQIYERLDRYLINHDMAMKVVNFRVNHLSFMSSDHRPIVASWDFADEISKTRSEGRLLRFEEGWTKFKETKGIVRDCWTQRSRNGADDLNNKVKKSIQNLHKWNRKRLKDSLKRAIAKKEEEILKLSNEDYELNSEEILKAETELDKLLEEEEDYWRNRSREIWLKNGYKNTKWFHA